MLIVCKQVATNYGVVDTDDGTISWVTKNELYDFARKVQIQGVDLNSGSVVCTGLKLTAGLCNWDKGDGNIFTNLARYSLSSSKQFEIVTKNRKSFKGFLSIGMRNADGSPITIVLNFTNNIYVELTKDMYNSYLGIHDSRKNLIL